MALTARQRWTAYGIAGAATLGAMAWVDRQQPAEPDVVAAREPMRPPFAAPAADPGPQEGEVRLDLLKRPPPPNPIGNPFGTPQPEAPPPQAAAPPAPPPPPQAPPLPFTYIGRWVENGQTTLYLARGGRQLAVRGPGPLDDAYAVESIGPRQIVLTYLPLGIRQVLPLEGPTASAARPAGPPEAAPITEDEESN